MADQRTSGCGMYSSTAAINSRICSLPISSSRPSSAARAEPAMIGISSPGNSYEQEVHEFPFQQAQEALHHQPGQLCS